VCSEILEAKGVKMISCTEFIPAYSELFKFLDKTGSEAAVMEFWKHLSDSFLGNLRDLAAQKSLAGCFEYWSHTLSEEAADFKMTLDEKEGFFRIEMRYCPSKGRLIEMEHIKPYEFYCEHCDLLYRRVLEPLGFKYHIDLSQADHAKCVLTVTKA
jgi:hypothetical protein